MQTVDGPQTLAESSPRSLYERLRDVIPTRHRQALRRVQRLWRRNPAELRELLGLVSTSSIVDVLQCYDEFNTRSGDYTEVRLRGYRQQVRLRNRTSDFAVFRDVILRQQYKIEKLRTVEFVLDAGANIGLTSLYLLHKYPQAQVIAVEPDSENFEIARHNLAPFMDRCHLVQAGVWCDASILTINRGNFRDGRHWATQTLPGDASSTDTIPAHTVDTLLERFGFPRLDLLKIDIEGAELQVFRDGDTRFLENTSCCAIECHGDDCEAAFRAAVAPYGFELSTQSELIVACKLK